MTTDGFILLVIIGSGIFIAIVSFIALLFFCAMLGRMK